MVQMLSEEALILAAALVACGLLLLGVMELLWPSRRRQPALRRPDLALRRRASVRPERLARRVLESGATESVVLRAAAATISVMRQVRPTWILRLRAG